MPPDNTNEVSLKYQPKDDAVSIAPPKPTEAYDAEVKKWGLIIIGGLNVLLFILRLVALCQNSTIQEKILSGMITIATASLTAIGGFVAGQQTAKKPK